MNRLVTCRGIKLLKEAYLDDRHEFLLSREIIVVFLSACEVAVWPAFSSRVFLLVFCDKEQMYFVGWCNGTPQSYDTLCVYNICHLYVIFCEQNWIQFLCNFAQCFFLNTYITESENTVIVVLLVLAYPGDQEIFFLPVHRLYFA